MSQIMTLSGMSPETIYQQVVREGVNPVDAGMLVGSWIIANSGRSLRVFQYSTPLPGDGAGCVPAFARSFVHADWIDGESVVQAEQTTVEDGFNTRFHRIETDLDALGRDAATGIACVNALRRELRVLLEEVRTEINRINADIHALRSTPSTTRPTTAMPGLLTILEGTHYFGEIQVQGRDAQVWDTPHGPVILPHIRAGEPEVFDFGRVQKAGMLARAIEENPAIREAFGGRITSFTTRDIVGRFGTVRSADGRTIRELVEGVPPQQQFGSLDAMVTAVSDAEAATLRADPGAQDALAGTLRLGERTGRLGSAPLDGMSMMPENARAALTAAGVNTLERLAELSPQRLNQILSAAGVNAAPGEVAQWAGTARTLVRIR